MLGTENMRTWLEISRSAIDHNIAQYKKIIGNKILAPVIKSNAYGHGILEVAQICEENKDVDWLCVANSQEALLLRKNGIKKNILLLSYLGNDAQELIKESVSLIAYNLEGIKKLNEIGKNLNKIVNVHIKIDTGLSRLGLPAEQVVEFVTHIKNSYFNFVNLQGIWTHFSEPAIEDREFTNIQVQKFCSIVKELEKIGIKIPYIHSSSTAGILTVNLECDNFFRPGIGLYGYWPSDYVKKEAEKKYPDFNLIPCMSWKTRVFSVREIEAESFVGYNRTYKASKKTKLALIPVGYYDGYDRRLSNIGHVIINGHIAKIAGLVCMNAIMLDVTGFDDIKVGDEAILIGQEPAVNVNSIANSVDMNPRDLTSKISLEIPRIMVP